MKVIFIKDLKKQGKVNEILHEYQLDCDGMCDIILKDFGKAKEDE